MRLSRTPVLLAIAIFALSSGFAKADLVSNPTFSLQPTPAPANYYAVIPSWTASMPGSNNVYSGALPMSGSNTCFDVFCSYGASAPSTVGFLQVYVPPYFGGYGIDPTSILYQTFTTVAGDVYDFSYLQAGRTGQPDGPSFTGSVLNGPGLGGTSLFSHTTDLTDGGFTSVSGDFTASSSSTTIEFAAVNDSRSIDETALVSNVNVNPAPEPSSFILLGTGLVGLAGAACRKMRKS